MNREPFSHFIVISGSGKKVGKTFMATALIRAFSGKFPLLALKISPHVHDSLGNTILRSTSPGIRIFQDLGSHRKNSGMFLEAGAMESYFMETGDEYLSEALDIFLRECNPLNYPVICESGALSRLIKPGLSIFITHATTKLEVHKQSSLAQADLVLPAGAFSTPEIIDRIGFSGNHWNLGSR